MNSVSLVSDYTLNCQNIEMVLGDPKRSKIYLLGEIHDFPSIIKVEKEILQKIASTGDVVLVESYNSFIMLNPKKISLTSDMPQDLWVMGWDSRKLVFETTQNINELIRLLPEKERFSENLRNTPESSIMLRRKLSIRVSDKEFEIEKIRAKNKELFEKRNDSLIRTVLVTRGLLPDARIFVIAGKNHFTPVILEEMQKIDATGACYISLIPTEVYDTKNMLDYAKLIASTTSLYLHRSSKLDPSGPCSLRHSTLEVEDVRKKSSPLVQKKQISSFPKLNVTIATLTLLLLVAALLIKN